MKGKMEQAIDSVFKKGKTITVKPNDRLVVNSANFPELSRNIPLETKKEQTGNSKAFSSEKKLYYHDIPTELIKRTAKRHNVGHVKYNDSPIPIAMNLNWRIGLDDPLYVMDRLNHIFAHLMDFIDNGNANDDNLGAIAWNVGFLMEVERLHPDVLLQVIGQGNYSGMNASTKQQELRKLAIAIKEAHNENS